MRNPVLIIVTCPTEKNAQDIGVTLIEIKLAACVHISEVNAMYWWDRKINQNPEHVLNIKTIDTHFDAIQKIIKEMYPYEVPAIEMLKLDGGSKKILDWLQNSVRADH